MRLRSQSCSALKSLCANLPLPVITPLALSDSKYPFTPPTETPHTPDTGKCKYAEDSELCNRTYDKDSSSISDSSSDNQHDDSDSNTKFVDFDKSSKSNTPFMPSRILPTPIINNNSRQINFLQKHISSLRELILSQSHQISELVAESRDMSKAYSKLVDKFSDTDNNIQQQVQLQQQLQKVKHLESLSTEQEETIREQQTVISQLESKCELQLKATEDANKAVTVISNQLQLLEQQLQGYQQQASMLEEKLIQRESTLAQQNNDITNYHSTINDLRKQLQINQQQRNAIPMVQPNQMQQQIFMPPQPPIPPSGHQQQNQQPFTRLTHVDYAMQLQ